MNPPVEITRELVRTGLQQARYLATAHVETVLFLALRLERPLLIEGPPGAGKTEIGKVLAATLGTDLIRLQCYEGLDEAKALYEWNYQKQLLRIQADRQQERQWSEVAHDIFGPDYLLERPLLRAITASRKAVLLIDEIDKADEELEAFLLEILSDFQVTVPELGTIAARHRPVVVLTSNRSRDLSEALKRRCLYLYLDFPGTEIERQIIDLKVPQLDERLRLQVACFVGQLRKLDLRKAPSIAESLDWARSLCALGIRELDASVVRDTLNVLLKHEEDLIKASGKVASLLSASTR
ncbi:MAG TPA: MoxR family ATPase [Terriglobales bacterium]|nr:MoxR family ATPase [Terriglobales bacterium]